MRQSGDTGITKTPHVCLIHDGKTGHQKQLEALAYELSRSYQADCAFHHYKTGIMEISRNKPEIIIGAGHNTHWPVLRSASRMDAKSCVVMSPSLPHALFDFVIAPRHDGPISGNHVFCTDGPMNKAGIPQTKAPIMLFGNKAAQNIVMIGGKSKHYRWSNDDLIRQLTELLSLRPEENFVCYNSRRTPEITNKALASLESGQFRFRHFNITENEELENTLCYAEEAFATPDSISMIYEALTSKTTVRLFELDEVMRLGGRSKICKEIQRLMDEGKVSGWQNNAALELKPVPAAARNAADWLARKLGWKSIHA